MTRETEENRLALRAAFRIARQPGSLGNPVLFLGGGRSGKSLLLRRLERGAKRRARTVLRLSFPAFTRLFRRALRRGKLPELEEKLLEVDFLLLDDLDSAGGSRRTQAFLASLWERRVGLRKQVVLASRLRPSEVPGLEPKLRSRFEGGFMISLSTSTGPRDLPALAGAVASRFGLPAAALLGRGGRLATTARAAFAALALDAGYRGGEVAAFLGGVSRAAIHQARRRSTILSATDPAFRAALESLAMEFAPAPETDGVGGSRRGY